MSDEHDEAACMIPGVRPRRTPKDILSYWRIKIERERKDQASCLKHGLPDQSKWHEGIADAGDQFADELEHLILPLLTPQPPPEPQPVQAREVSELCKHGRPAGDALVRDNEAAILTEEHHTRERDELVGVLMELYNALADIRLYYDIDDDDEAAIANKSVLAKARAILERFPQ